MKTLLVQLIDEEIKCTYDLLETQDQFLEKITNQYFLEISKLKLFSPFQLSETVKEEILQEALEIYRKKTYGFLQLRHYRLAKSKLNQKKRTQKISINQDSGNSQTNSQPLFESE